MPYFEIYISEDDLDIIYTDVKDPQEWLQHAVDNKVRWLIDYICRQEGKNPDTLSEKEKYKIVKKNKKVKEAKKVKVKFKKKKKTKPSKEDSWRLSG